MLNAINANKGLLFYPRIRPLDLMFARAGLEMATLGMVFIVIMGFNALYQGQLAVHDPLQVLAGLVLACLLGIGCGIFTGALFSFSSAVLRIIPILLRPLIWISGLWFTASELPTNLREILMWNPILHLTEYIRNGWYSQYRAEYFDLAYLGGWILVPTYLGLILERIARRRMELA